MLADSGHFDKTNLLGLKHRPEMRAEPKVCYYMQDTYTSHFEP